MACRRSRYNLSSPQARLAPAANFAQLRVMPPGAFLVFALTVSYRRPQVSDTTGQ